MERNHIEDTVVDGMIILRRIIKKFSKGHTLDSFVLGSEELGCCCRRCNEISGSIKCGEFD